MKPVKTGTSGPQKSFIAASQIPFGALVVRAGANTVKAATAADDECILGVAVDDQVQHSVDGFYAAGDVVPIIISGTARLWTRGVSVSLIAGDFVEVASVGGGSTTIPHGIVEEAGSAAGETYTVTTVAKLMEDLTIGAGGGKAVASNVSVGDTTVTLSGADMTALNLSVGDYILMDDNGGNAAVNRVKSKTATVITLVQPATVAMTAAGGSDLVYKMYQAEALLLK